MFSASSAPTKIARQLNITDKIMNDMLLKQDCKCYFCSIVLTTVSGNLSRIIPITDPYWDRFTDAHFRVPVYNHPGNLCIMCDKCYKKRVDNTTLFEIKDLYRKYINNHELLHGETLTCMHCDKCYQSLKAMKSHILTAHPNSSV